MSAHNWTRSLEASEEDLGEGGVVDQDASYVLQGHGVNHQQKKEVPGMKFNLSKFNTSESLSFYILLE